MLLRTAISEKRSEQEQSSPEARLFLSDYLSDRETRRQEKRESTEPTSAENDATDKGLAERHNLRNSFSALSSGKSGEQPSDSETAYLNEKDYFGSWRSRMTTPISAMLARRSSCTSSASLTSRKRRFIGMGGGDSVLINM